MTIEVVNVKGLTGDSRAGITYVGRKFAGWEASPLGNPYRLLDGGPRDGIIQAYKKWLWENYLDPFSEERAELERIAEMVRDGQDVKLGCWCSPLSCHADVIKACVEYMLSKETK